MLRVGHEYIGFMALVSSLYVVAAGIHINVNGEATPRNTAFLVIGALLANILGATGASMSLVRPWIRMNRYRVTEHHVVFFIFIVLIHAPVPDAGACRHQVAVFRSAALNLN